MGWLNNICALTDSYKATHWKQYPPKTSNVYSYFESRVGAKYDETVFFGLKYILSEYLEGRVVNHRIIERMKKRYELHFDNDLFNADGWSHILHEHDGCLPIRIRAVPEGTVVPTGNVLMTVENTDPAVPWLTNWVETLLTQVWYPCTVATQSREMKKVLKNALDRSGSVSNLPFMLHDFGFRGTTCPEQAAIGGSAHLVNFKGTDNVPALELVDRFYDEEMAGFSVPASEHSTITMWGEENESEAYRNILEEFPTGIVACVSDSYDIYNACANLWGDKLRDAVLQRDGVLVIRPDSGDPRVVLPRLLEILAGRFGFTANSKGYRVINPKVRLIQGDGINIDSVEPILDRLMGYGWSADNVSFGSGGGLLQQMNRDTQRFAFKASSGVVDGVRRNVSKRPVTDPSKQSKQGRLKLVDDNGVLRTVGAGDARTDLLQTVFEDGVCHSS